MSERYVGQTDDYGVWVQQVVGGFRVLAVPRSDSGKPCDYDILQAVYPAEDRAVESARITFGLAEGLTPCPSVPPLVALVYRVGKGCRQYPFGTVEALEHWCGRYPYRNEELRVMVVQFGQVIATANWPASAAAAWVRKCLGGGDNVQ